MLTDAECKNAVCSPGKKRERLACSGGLDALSFSVALGIGARG